jgi:L-2-hydroxycarboxylate dehydrogenase (NAD+)
VSAHSPQLSIELYECGALEAEWLHEVRCEDCRRCGRETKIKREELEAFTARVLAHHGVKPDDARVTARVLVSADLRGIVSHGVARLGRYIAGIRDGYIRPDARFEVIEPAPSIAVIDARDGIGQVVSERAMDLAIGKAKEHGIGVVTVKNSNHYGIAGYYALKAVEKGLIGISMTNSAPLVIPTHGAKAILGTNPIALGAPAAKHPAFLLDTATSVVPRGKLEVYDRDGKAMPLGWAADEKGADTPDAGLVLKNLVARIGGGILPLGGRGESFGGHKGFGLALMVDILSGVLSGSAFGPDVHNLKRQVPEGQVASPRVGHFFLALDIGRFMPLDAFKKRMDEYMAMIKQSPRADGEDRIFVHGEKEFERTEANLKAGIPVADNVFDALVKIAADAGVEPPRCVAGGISPRVRKNEEP